MSTDQPEATVPVGTNPEQNAFDPELPQTIVTNRGSDNISFVNTTTRLATASAPVGIAPVAVAVALQTAEPRLSVAPTSLFFAALAGHLH